MLTRFVGDIHGKVSTYIDVTKGFDGNTVQVGDFTIGFWDQKWHDRVNEYHASGQHKFIRGNHDHPERCKEMVGWIPDGTVNGDVMFIGGAWSIDHMTRTPGIDWWRDEELSYQELGTLIDVYDQVKPRVMVTHDCPTLASYYMFVRAGETLAGRVQYLTRTGEALQAMFELHQPEYWIFGHWHDTKNMEINGTKFQCLGECDYMDLEV